MASFEREREREREWEKKRQSERGRENKVIKKLYKPATMSSYI